MYNMYYHLLHIKSNILYALYIFMKLQLSHIILLISLMHDCVKLFLFDFQVNFPGAYKRTQRTGQSKTRKL